MQLRRLADIAIDLYAMTACLGRASRSVCLGLQHCDHEVCAFVFKKQIFLKPYTKSWG